jgi:hypothetical protein
MTQANLSAAITKDHQPLSIDRSRVAPELGGLQSPAMAGRATISFMGSRFNLKSGGDTEVLEGVTRLPVVILGTSPYVSRSYYEGDYTPGSTDAPTCSSFDGITPRADSPDRQHSQCRGCPQNVKGSKIYAGRPGFACAFHRFAAVMLADRDDDTIYQVKFPAGSLFGKDCSEGMTLPNFLKQIDSYNASNPEQEPAPSYAVVVAIRFDMNAAVPRPVLTGMGWVQPNSALESRIAAALNNPEALAIVRGEAPVAAE